MIEGTIYSAMARLESDTKKLCKALSDIKSGASFDICKKNIEALGISKMIKIKRLFTLIVIRCIAEEYASPSVFEKIADYFNILGYGVEFYNDNNISYMLYTFFSAEKFSDSKKKSVIDSYFSNHIFSQRDYIYLTLLFAEAGDKRFLADVMRIPCCGQEEAIAASVFYCAVNRKWDILEFIFDNYKVSEDVLLLAVNYSELFCGEIAERFSDRLPSAFRKSDGSVKSVDELILFLFRSKRYRKMIGKTKRNVNDLDVLIHIADLLGDDALDSIKNCIPEIRTVSLLGISCLMNSTQMLSVFKPDKNGVLINAYDTSLKVLMRSSIGYMETLKKFLNKMQSVGCEIYIDPAVWNDFDYIYVTVVEEYELLNVLKEFGVKVRSVNEETSLLVLCLILFKDDAKLTRAVIDIWQEIVSDDSLFSKAVEYVVEKKKYQSLEVINQRRASFDR